MSQANNFSQVVHNYLMDEGYSEEDATHAWEHNGLHLVTQEDQRFLEACTVVFDHLFEQENR